MQRRTFLKSLLALTGSGYLGRRAQAGMPYFLLPPTTLHVSETSAVVYCWLSEPTSNGALILRQKQREIRRLALASDQAQIMVRLEGLSPATSYEYIVEVGGREPAYLDFADAWGSVAFHTQPYAWPIRFAAIGDSGFGDTVTRRLAANMVGQEPDFFIHLGDVVYNMEDYGSDSWRNWAVKYYRPFQEILRRMPHYATVGNHDRETATLLDGQSFYFWAFPPLDAAEAFNGQRQWYRFEANDVRFLALNSQSFYTDRSLAAQNAWLDAQLADTSFRTNILFFHIPLWTSGSVHPDDGAPVAQTWQHRFQAVAEHIGLVLTGHSHLYERIQRGNIPYITSGGGSASIYRQGERVAGSQVAISLANYVLVEVYQDHIALKAFDIENNLLDETEWMI
jgi:predicted phosphodiesterase